MMVKKILHILTIFFIALSVGNKSYSASNSTKISNVLLGTVTPNVPGSFAIDMNGPSPNPMIVYGDITLGGSPAAGGARVNTNTGGIEYKLAKSVTLKNGGSTLDVDLNVTEIGDLDSSVNLFIGCRVTSTAINIVDGNYSKTVKIRYRDNSESSWKKQKVKIKLKVKEVPIGIDMKDSDIDIGKILLEDKGGAVIWLSLDGIATVISGNVTIIGSPKRGRVKLRGQPNKSIMFIRHSAKLRNEMGDEIDMEPVLNSDSASIGVDGYIDQDIGAIMTIPAGVEQGNYSGNFSFDVNY